MGVRHTGVVTGTGRFTLRKARDGRTRFQWKERLTFPMLAGRTVRRLRGAAGAALGVAAEPHAAWPHASTAAGYATARSAARKAARTDGEHATDENGSDRVLQVLGPMSMSSSPAT